jgi:hypothetical protein
MGPILATLGPKLIVAVDEQALEKIRHRFPDPIPKVYIGSHLNRIVLRALRISKLVEPDYGLEATCQASGGSFMQNVIELNFEETKAVVGGAAAAPASAVMRKGSPVAEIIGLLRDFENAFGGGQMAKRAQL